MMNWFTITMLFYNTLFLTKSDAYKTTSSEDCSDNTMLYFWQQFSKTEEVILYCICYTHERRVGIIFHPNQASLIYAQA